MSIRVELAGGDEIAAQEIPDTSQMPFPTSLLHRLTREAGITNLGLKLMVLAGSPQSGK